MTASAQRTPVSVLFDLCNQNDWTAEYELQSVIGASHDPTFTYKVQVGNVVATASGQSKKKAKHFAAKSALEQLLANPPESMENGFYFENVKVTAENLDQIILEPSSEPVPMGKDARNAIGELQEYCTKRKKAPPYYETVSECGPPHDKIFSVMCIVDSFTTYGEGKTKRIAKRIAAESMYDQLRLTGDKEDDFEKKSNISKEETDLSSPSKSIESESLIDTTDLPSSVLRPSESEPSNSTDSTENNTGHDHIINDISSNMDKIFIDSDQDF